MELPFKELTHRIIGCAMEVHKVLGRGFQEYIYHRALAIEMKVAGLKFEEEFELPIFYKGDQIGLRRLISELKTQYPLKLKLNQTLTTLILHRQ